MEDIWQTSSGSNFKEGIRDWDLKTNGKGNATGWEWDRTWELWEFQRQDDQRGRNWPLYPHIVG